MPQPAVGVFAPANIRSESLFSHGQPEVGLAESTEAGHAGDRHFHADRTWGAARGDVEINLRLYEGRRVSNRLLSEPALAPDELRPPIDDHLGRIEHVGAQRVPVLPLSFGERRRGERIAPAKSVPVLHVFAERDY